MRKTTVTLLATFFLLGAAAPALAASLDLEFTGRQGAIYRGTVPDEKLLTDGCTTTTRPQGQLDPRPEVTLKQNGKTVGVLRGWQDIANGDVWLEVTKGPLVPVGTWCKGAPDLIAALQSATQVGGPPPQQQQAPGVPGAEQPAIGPSSRGPWLAFIALIGGLTIAIVLVALWGKGVGPEPALGVDEDEDEAEAEAVAAHH